MARVYNFSAGPAVLPQEVLEQAKEELVEYPGAGMSVMEMSHRSKEYLAIIDRARDLVRELMAIPDNYRVLFLQGGATLQFTMLPMNLITDPENQVADYVMTGSWSKKAASEAKKVMKRVNAIASSESVNFSRIPRQEEWNPTPGASYCHITSNNTIFGTEYHFTPDTGDTPLITDASSNILSRPMDVSKFGVIYAGAQKNLGPAGVTLVVVREDLMGLNANLPVMLDYKAQADNDSMLNTPPTYAIYILKLVLEWVKEQGGVSALEEINIRKAKKLYDAIDASGFYQCPTEVASRSRMNVPFTLADPDKDAQFLSEAKAAGLYTLKGHRSVGGMRASIYNAMPEAGIDALIGFMGEFERKNG